MSFDVWKQNKTNTPSSKLVYMLSSVPVPLWSSLTLSTPNYLLALPSFPIFHTLSSWKHCTMVHWLISGLWLTLVRHQWESDSKRSGKWRGWVSLVLFLSLSETHSSWSRIVANLWPGLLPWLSLRLSMRLRSGSVAFPLSEQMWEGAPERWGVGGGRQRLVCV